MKLIEKIIGPSSKIHNATVIFFHGSGDTGSGIIEWIRFLLGRDLNIPNVRFVFPTAPMQRYTPLDNELSNVWFNREAIDIAAPESRKSLESIYESVNELISRETLEIGINPKRIIVGGFSMGGSLALHIGYHLHSNIGGVFALSSFLNRDSIVYETSLKYKTNQQLPKLLMYHGGRDTLVPSKWGEETFAQLQKFNVSGEFRPLKNTLHELKKQEILDLEVWIQELLKADETQK